MIDRLDWVPIDYSRGDVLDANLEVEEIAGLGLRLVPVWAKCQEAFGRLARAGSPVSVLVEVWLDSGRLIYVLSQEREFLRLVVSVPMIEHCYHELPEEEGAFDAGYSDLIGVVTNAVVSSLQTFATSRELRRLVVEVSDADDRGSRAAVFGSAGPDGPDALHH